MADIIRKMTIQKGYDPRDFVLFAFGGAGPAHAAVFAAELGVKGLVVPQKKTASCWCAFGAASAHILHIHEAVEIMEFDRPRIDDHLAALELLARGEMTRERVAAERVGLQFALDIRHKGQINEVEVVLPDNRAPAEAVLREAFFTRYEQLYGRSAAFRGARLEIVTFRVRARAATAQPRLTRAAAPTRGIADAARRGRRAVYWDTLQRVEDTAIFDGALLVPGNELDGPAIVETTDTSVVVPPGRVLAVDPFGNFTIRLDG
jgi:N-methylhydantoinase A